ncbi:hypothetical protein D3C84_594130 [compost metagenome]
MAGGAQNQQFEIGIVTRSAGTFDAVERFQIELTVAIAGNDSPTHIGEQLALRIGQTRGLLQHAGTARVVDHITTDVAARLEQQLAIRCR